MSKTVKTPRDKEGLERRLEIFEQRLKELAERCIALASSLHPEGKPLREHDKMLIRQSYWPELEGATLEMRQGALSGDWTLCDHAVDRYRDIIDEMP